MRGKKNKSKILEVLEIIFYIIISIAIISSIIFFIYRKGLRSLLVICPIAIIIIALSISIKRDKKKEKAYRDQYVSKVILADKTFGEIEFEKDILHNTLTCMKFKMLFGDYDPVICIESYREEDMELYFRSLEHLYSKQDEIISNLKKNFREAYPESAEVTPENLKIDRITIQRYGDCCIEDADWVDGEDFLDKNPDDMVIVVVGDPNKNTKLTGSYGSFPVVYMDCSTRKTCYTMED